MSGRGPARALNSRSGGCGRLPGKWIAAARECLGPTGCFWAPPAASCCRRMSANDVRTILLMATVKFVNAPNGCGPSQLSRPTLLTLLQTAVGGAAAAAAGWPPINPGRPRQRVFHLHGTAAVERLPQHSAHWPSGRRPCWRNARAAAAASGGKWAAVSSELIRVLFQLPCAFRYLIKRAAPPVGVQPNCIGQHSFFPRPLSNLCISTAIPARAVAI